MSTSCNGDEDENQNEDEDENQNEDEDEDENENKSENDRDCGHHVCKDEIEYRVIHCHIGMVRPQTAI